MKNISRRDFLKGAVASAVGAAATGVLGACSSDASTTTTAEETTAAETEAVTEAATEAPVEAPVTEAAASEDPYMEVNANGDTVYYSMRRTWVGQAPEISESDIAGEYSADVIVIGANYSGANCFRMACEKGATCIVIDSQSEENFNSYGGQLGHFNSKWQEEILGIPSDYFDPVDFIDSYQLQCAGRAQPDLIKQFAHRNGEMVDWMMELYNDYS